MYKEVLSKLEDYKSKDESYEQILRNLERCILNVQLCSTQISFNIARVWLLLEIEYAAYRFSVFKDREIDDILYAFCCRIDFRSWVIKLNKYLYELGTYENEGKLSADNTKDSDYNKHILNDLSNTIEYFNNIAEIGKWEIFPEYLIPSLIKLNNDHNSKAIKDAVANILWRFIHLLDQVNQTITSPPIGYLTFFYTSFFDFEDEKENDFHSFLEKNQNKSNFLSLLKERRGKLFDNEIRQYCPEKETWLKLFDMNPICEPSYVRLSDFIWRKRDDDNRIEIAKEIVRLSQIWSTCENMIDAYTKRESNNLKISAPSGNNMKDGLPQSNWDKIFVDAIDIAKVKAKIPELLHNKMTRVNCYVLHKVLEEVDWLQDTMDIHFILWIKDVYGCAFQTEDFKTINQGLKKNHSLDWDARTMTSAKKSIYYKELALAIRSEFISKSDKKNVLEDNKYYFRKPDIIIFHKKWV